jgi:hypothetical protein
MRKVSFYKLLSLGILISMIVSCSERDEDLPLKNSNSKKQEVNNKEINLERFENKNDVIFPKEKIIKKNTNDRKSDSLRTEEPSEKAVNPGDVQVPPH